MLYRDARCANGRLSDITGLDLALLINFKNARLDWKRVLRPQAPGEHDIPDLHPLRLLIRAIRLIRG